MRSTTKLLLACTLIVSACAETDIGSAIPAVASRTTLTLSSTATMTSAGDIRNIKAVVDNTDPNNNDRRLTWTTNVPDVVEVIGTDTGAVVVATGDGTVTITAATATSSASVDVTVRRVIQVVELFSPDTIVAPGQSMRLVVVARDARRYIIYDASGFKFTSSNTTSVVVANDGTATALFSPFQTQGAQIAVSVNNGTTTLSDTVHVSVGGRIAPPEFDYLALMLTDYARPIPVNLPGQGVIFFTRLGGRMHYTMLWSALSGAPTSAHLHGPASVDDIVDVLVDIPLTAPQLDYGSITGVFTAANIRSIRGRPAISMDSLSTLLGNRAIYTDMHTARFGNGEIRGQSYENFTDLVAAVPRNALNGFHFFINP